MTLDDEDVGGNRFKTMRQSRILYTQDISRKRDRIEKSGNPCLNISDIEGAKSKRLYEPLSKSCMYLSNEGIDGAFVKPMHFRKKVASVDKPQKEFIKFCYLPKEAEPVKFQRDTLQIDV